MSSPPCTLATRRLKCNHQDVEQMGWVRSAGLEDIDKMILTLKGAGLTAQSTKR